MSAKFKQYWENIRATKYQSLISFPSAEKIFATLNSTMKESKGAEIAILASNENVATTIMLSYRKDLSLLEIANFPSGSLAKDLYETAKKVQLEGEDSPTGGGNSGGTGAGTPADCPKCPEVACTPNNLLFGMDSRIVVGVATVVGGVIGYLAGKK